MPSCPPPAYTGWSVVAAVVTTLVLCAAVGYEIIARWSLKLAARHYRHKAQQSTERHPVSQLLDWERNLNLMLVKNFCASSPLLSCLLLLRPVCCCHSPKCLGSWILKMSVCSSPFAVTQCSARWARGSQGGEGDARVGVEDWGDEQGDGGRAGDQQEATGGDREAER